MSKKLFNKSKKVLADKYQLCIYLNPDFDYKYIDIHTRHNVTNEQDIIKLYVTPERIKEWKEELIKKIQECENPFKFSNGDFDCYEMSENKLFEMPEEYVNRAKNALIDKVYVLASKMYDYHKDITDTDYYYYKLVDGHFQSIKFDEFCEILKENGYNDVKQYRWHYQADILETKWLEDYPNNYAVVDGYKFNHDNLNKVKAEFSL